ncbi:hypothetical protein GCM10018781_80880 [Kitasatospora indigofera]|uniref:DNA polymerase III beta sliding clamp central domain-containing protein n=1 Tax=Kitasatospora indigofera TaxID=67307 RepID=A0A919DBR1_9ACTN|nr:hypothetical protein [Kitasatospora indigofera]GHE28812.1 hypothetical protein GCM10018781_80880 [Kitasatospora indigofera]
MSLTLTDLPTLVGQLTPHISPDETLPVLHGIYLEATGTHLFACATDRYTFALTRREAPDSAPWKAVLTRADLLALRALFPARRRAADLTLTFEPPAGEHDPDGHLTIGDADRALRLSANAPLAGLFPKWRPLFAAALAAEPQLTDEAHLNAAYLARWAKAPAERYEPLTVWSAGPEKPLLIAAGHGFLGLQMPVKADTRPGRTATDRRDRAALRTTWTDALNTPAAVSERHLKAA